MRARSATRELVRLRTGRDPEDLLRELYVERRHTQEEVARALGVGRDTINAWLKEYGISREDRAPLELDPA
jgi:DNA-binding XRE family transcriptional regulator